MDVRQLRYFVRIVESGSLSRAARVLHVAQPALSQQIAGLEAELGVKLLLRSVRGVEPTQGGHVLYGYAQVVLRHLDNARMHVRQASDRPAGQVWLGLPTSTAVVLAVPLIEAARAAFPDVVLQVVEDLSNNLKSMLLAGRLDAALLFDQQPESGLVAAPLLGEELFHVTAAKRAPGVRRAATTRLDRIARDTFVLPRGRHTLRQFIERAFGAAGCELRVGLELDSLHTLKLAVEAGLGASILTWSVVHRDVEAGRLAARRITGLPALRLVSLCTSSLFPQSPACEAIAGILPQVAAGLVRTGCWQGVRMTGMGHKPA